MSELRLMSELREKPLSWAGIVRLGLVQAALGSVVVVVTSTLNRVMVVEYALPALVPGALVALHYAVQMVRPRFGYGSDRGGRRTPWIVGGMAVLAAGGILCAAATVAVGGEFISGLGLSIIGYALVGFGVSAAGTSLLVLLAKRVDDRRRAAAAMITWMMMIAGFAVTSTLVGRFLDPFSPERLVKVSAVAAAAAFLLATMAVWGMEPSAARTLAEAPRSDEPRFSTALRQVWSEPRARAFTLFIFISMLAYSAQELLLEPFCGLVFGFSLGESARLSGVWHGSVLLGMIGVGLACSGTRRFGSLRAWTIGGCCASAIAISSVACAAIVGPGWPLRVSISALGISNGVFAVAAISQMMELAHRERTGSAGVRMGLWGAAQAVAFALGGLSATCAVDAVRYLSGSPSAAFSIVFCIEALLFAAAARYAARVDSTRPERAADLDVVTA